MYTRDVPSSIEVGLKADARAPVKVRLFAVVSRAIEEGLSLGYKKAHKHTDTPGDAHILEQQHESIMHSLDEVLELE